MTLETGRLAKYYASEMRKGLPMAAPYFFYVILRICETARSSAPEYDEEQTDCVKIFGKMVYDENMNPNNSLYQYCTEYCTKY